MLLLAVVVIKGVDFFRAPVAPDDFSARPVTTLDGKQISLAQLSAERPLLLYFWATWCAICRYTTPTVDRLAAEGQNVLTVALRSGDDRRIRRYLQAKGMRFAVVNDPLGQHSASWRVSVTPDWVIIDKGKVVSSTSGWSSYYLIKLRLWWAGL